MQPRKPEKRWERAVIDQISLDHSLTSQKKVPVKGPLQNVSIIKPLGPASYGNKAKRTYRIEPVKPSEARIIKLNDNRPHIITKFPNEIVRHALLDSGATCSSISSKFLEELQENGFVPTDEANVKVHGCIPGVRKTIDTVAYLSFQLETGHWITNAPFIVHDGNYDVLIGSVS